MILDTRLNFDLHLKNVQNKVSKTIDLLPKLQNTLTKTSLIIIFKSFIRPHIDYGDIIKIYDSAYNISFHLNIESIQCKAALTITGAVKGASRGKLYQELGFESLQQKCWYRKLCCLSLTEISFSTSPLTKHQIFFSKHKTYSPTSDKTWLFWKLFFLIDYKRVEQSEPAYQKIRTFKSNILKFIWPKPNNVYYCHNPKETKLLTRLCLNLSHPREHKFEHSFQDCLNPVCPFGNEIKTCTHYLLYCPTYMNERMNPLNKIKSINCCILGSSDAAVTKSLLFGDNTLSYSSNTLILNPTIEYIISTQIFEGSILNPV